MINIAYTTNGVTIGRSTFPNSTLKFSIRKVNFIEISIISSNSVIVLSPYTEFYGPNGYYSTPESLLTELTEQSSTALNFKEIALTSGLINNSNKVFVWDIEPTHVYWQGQLLRESVDYVLSGTTTTFINSPNTGDSVWAYGNY